MKTLQISRYIILAVMVTGSFANFAQNEWGNSIIVFCQMALAASFAVEVFLAIRESYILQNNKKPSLANMLGFCLLVFLSLFNIMLGTFSVANGGNKDGRLRARILECSLLFAGFLGAIFRNLFLTGAAILSVVALAGLAIFYLVAATRFMVKTYKQSKPLAFTGGGIVIGGVILAVSTLFIIQHWPGGSALLNTGLALSLALLLPSLLRSFNTTNGTTTINKMLATVSANFVFIFYTSLVFSAYIWAKRVGIAPSFYSQHYPASVYKQTMGEKALGEKDAYENFIEHCRKNGLIK